MADKKSLKESPQSRKPDISIIIPVYNGKQYISEAIESVLIQSYTAWELILVNDGSTDGSSRLITDFAHTDDRIRVISQENSGISKAVNTGIENSSGKYFVRLDQDDLCEPDRLLVQKQFLDSHEEIVAVGSYALCIDSDGNPLYYIEPPTNHEEIDKEMINGPIRATMVSSSVMMRRTALEKVGGCRSAFDTAEDRDLWLRFAEIGKLANISVPLVRYRLHAKSLSSSSSELQRQQCWNCITAACERRGVPVQIEDFENACRSEPKHVKYRKWGWAALDSGFLKSARKYALRSFFLRPQSLESWRLLYFALRGH